MEFKTIKELEAEIKTEKEDCPLTVIGYRDALKDVLGLIDKKLNHWKLLIKRCKDIANKDYDEIEIPIYQGKIITFLELKARIEGK